MCVSVPETEATIGIVAVSDAVSVSEPVTVATTVTVRPVSS